MISTSQQQESVPSILKTGLAFRPFFWLASVFVVISLTVWYAFYSGIFLLNPRGGMMWWHQHEMLFGVAVAVVVGFLLTAVQNWTGLPSLKSTRLWLLTLLWLVARVAIAFSEHLNATVVMLLDLAFLPFVAVAMGSYVVRAKRWRNLIFVPILIFLTLANLGMHWGNLHGNYAMSLNSAYMAVWLIVTLIVVIGGRVIPIFTTNGLRVHVRPMHQWAERLLIANALTVCLAFALRALGVSLPGGLVAIPLVLIAGLSTSRWMSWHPLKGFKEPMIWGLHTSYLFIIAGTLLWAIAEIKGTRFDSALHTITIGGMMAIILTMMSRVSLGHTGRLIRGLQGKNAVMAAIFIAALLRGMGLLIWPAGTLMFYKIAMLLCIAAFAWFTFHYTRTLWTPRADNRPG